jgi:hypothetical protein
MISPFVTAAALALLLGMLCMSNQLSSGTGFTLVELLEASLDAQRGNYPA